MSSKPQLGSGWTRALTILCVLVVMLASTIEVTHAHGSVLLTSSPTGSDADRSIGSDTPCPFCIAAHAPALALQTVQVGPVVEQDGTVQAVQPDRASSTFDFSLLVRPPPVG